MSAATDLPGARHPAGGDWSSGNPLTPALSRGGEREKLEGKPRSRCVVAKMLDRDDSHWCRRIRENSVDQQRRELKFEFKESVARRTCGQHLHFSLTRRARFRQSFRHRCLYAPVRELDRHSFRRRPRYPDGMAAAAPIIGERRRSEMRLPRPRDYAVRRRSPDSSVVRIDVPSLARHQSNTRPVPHETCAAAPAMKLCSSGREGHGKIGKSPITP